MFARMSACAALLALVGPGLAWPQDFRVETEHPRLFLQPRKLLLLQRERERQSARWQQFEALMAAPGSSLEPGFAAALFSQVSGEAAYCQQAVAWSLGEGSDLRQLALVFDWCQATLSQEDSRKLAARLERGIQTTSADPSVPAVRDRVLAAIALAGHSPSLPEQQLRQVVEKWWRGQMAPALTSGREAVPRDQMWAFLEILHALRDTLRLDLRDAAPEYFHDLPVSRLLGYYPGPYPSAENEFYIPAGKVAGEPDLKRAALARVADLSLVALDANNQENQFLQGWLTQDRLLMRGAFGVPYEFLWANPYQPGLSFYHAPLYSHNRSVGTLFMRSSWDQDATWFGYLDGELQVFDKGGLKTVTGQPASKPIRLADAAVYVLGAASSYRVSPPDVGVVFFVGLRPGAGYTVEVEGAKRLTATADAGGILKVDLAERPGAAIRLRLSQ
jgi:hypothetical protein